MTARTISDPQRTLMEVVALLTAAADKGFAEAGRDPAVHSMALGAQIVASSTLSLLPEELDAELDALQLDPAVIQLDLTGLIAAADQAARRHPVETYPVGASAIVVALGDLMAEGSV